MVLIIKKDSTKETIEKIWDKLRKARKIRTVNVSKYCGALKFKEDGLTLQKNWRSEWD